MKEKRKVLDLLAQKKISAEEANDLLKSLEGKQEKAVSARKLVLEIRQQKGLKAHFRIAIPLIITKMFRSSLTSAIEWSAEFGESEFDLNALNWNEIISMASSGDLGDIVNLNFEQGEDTPFSLRIFVE